MALLDEADCVSAQKEPLKLIDGRLWRIALNQSILLPI